MEGGYPGGLSPRLPVPYGEVNDATGNQGRMDDPGNPPPAASDALVAYSLPSREQAARGPVVAVREPQGGVEK